MRKDIDDHLHKDCIEQMVRCSGCKSTMKRRQFQNHRNNECEHRIIPCEYKQFGCEVNNIKARDMKQHLTEYQLQHLSQKFEFTTKQVSLSIFFPIFIDFLICVCRVVQ